MNRKRESLNSRRYSKVDRSRIETRQIERPDDVQEITELEPLDKELNHLTSNNATVSADRGVHEMPRLIQPATPEVSSVHNSQAGSSINGLFALLSKLEAVEGATVVRIGSHPEGIAVGQICMDNGIVVNARSAGSTASVTDYLTEEFSRKNKLKDIRQVESEPEVNILAKGGAIPRHILKNAQRQFVADEILQMVRSGAGWNAAIECADDKPTALAEYGSTPLQVMLDGIGRDMPKLVEDVAWKFYDQWAEKADGALLLYRPNNRTYLPVPSKINGMEGIKLSELRAICRSAGEMCQPVKFIDAGYTPELTTFIGGDSNWICAAGNTHYVLLRLSQRHQVAMAIGSMVREMKNSK